MRVKYVSTIHDILYPGPEGTKKRYITLRNVRGQYNIVELRRTKRVVLALIDMDDIEQQFLQKFTERLKETQRFDDYEQRLAKAEDEQKIKERKKNLRDTIHELNERIDGLFLTLQSTWLKPQERDEYIVERQRPIRRREAVQNEMNIQSPVQVYLKYKDLFQQMGKYWHRYSFEDRQALVALLVRRVYIEPLSHHFTKITIEWKAFPKDEGILYRRNASTLYWEPEEDQILRELYPTAQVETVQKALPRRSWNGIRTRGSDLHIRRLIKTKLTFPTDMSLQDLQIVETYGIPGDKLGETLFTTWG